MTPKGPPQSTADMNYQGQNDSVITILRPGGASPSKATSHGLLDKHTSRVLNLARGVDLLPEIREEHELLSPLLSETFKIDMERKRFHTSRLGGGPSRGKGNESASAGGDSKVLMAVGRSENSQQRPQHQSRSSQTSSDVFNPGKFFDSVFRFQVDGERLKDQRYAGSQRAVASQSRSFGEPTVTWRGRGSRGKKLVTGRDQKLKTTENMGHNSKALELPVLDIRRQDAPRLPELDPDVVRPRPFLSHARRGSTSSSSSSNSTATESSSIRPTSTCEDARISISSTVYNGSSMMSHSNIYSPADDRIGSDRTSFIDFLPIPKARTMADEPSPSTERVPTVDAHDFLTVHGGEDGSRARSPKPPIPTTPKPHFGNRSVPSLALRRRPSPCTGSDNDLPPTTNYLKAEERAELIRKSRKLAQVFGQTPGAGVMPQQDSWVSFLDLPLDATHRGRHLRGTASVSNPLALPSDVRRGPGPLPVWPPPEGTQYLTASGRRHSTPLTPDEFSFLHDTGSDDRSSCYSRPEYIIEVGSQEGEPSTDLSVLHGDAGGDDPNGEDTTSFIDLSEEGLPDDGVSAIISNSPPRKDGRHRSPSPSTRYLFQFEHLSPEEQTEELRRRKREKLAKLHRFLGSRIPTNLVLGIEDPFLSLPPPPLTQMDSNDDATPKAWLRRRRSSSVAAFPHWSDDHDRVKEDLNDKEKAINVRRAQKMEKMFGVAPPQTLYHTRHGASPSASLAGLSAPQKSRSAVPGSTPMVSPPSSPKNMNQSPYKNKSRKDDRPGSPESQKHLLSKRNDQFDVNEGTSGQIKPRGRSGSLVYTHYQHSLNSLVDIIDRDDRESLAELHEYLNSNESPSPPLKEFMLARDRRPSIASIKSERRRSLPARTSISSLASEYSISAIASPKPEVTDFQLRRRRAAKLTNFFGVDYRDLIRDVLDSIENGLEHERKRGTINPEEAEDLLQKLREIKTKRDGIF